MRKILVFVKPSSNQSKIIETHPATDVNPAEYTVYLRAKPHDGEANTTLIKMLSKHFNVPKTSIKILRGHKSHHKTIEL